MKHQNKRPLQLLLALQASIRPIILLVAVLLTSLYAHAQRIGGVPDRTFNTADSGVAYSQAFFDPYSTLVPTHNKGFMLQFGDIDKHNLSFALYAVPTPADMYSG